MRLDRCLLIACGTLSHACDSKTDPTNSQTAPHLAPVHIALAGDAPLEQLFSRLGPSTARFVLAPDLELRYAVPAGSTTVTLARDGSIHFGSLHTPLDEAGKNTLRAALADVKTNQIDLVVDRTQPVHALVELVGLVRAQFPEIRVAAGVPSGPTLGRIVYDESLTVIGDNIETIRSCVNRTMPVTSQRIELELRIDDHRAIDRVGVRGDSGLPPDLSQCLTAAALAWKTTLAPGTHRVPFEVVLQ